MYFPSSSLSSFFVFVLAVITRYPSFISPFISSFLNPGRFIVTQYSFAFSLISVCINPFVLLVAFLPSNVGNPKKSSNKVSPKILGINISHPSFLSVLLSYVFLERVQEFHLFIISCPLFYM